MATAAEKKAEAVALVEKLGATKGCRYGYKVPYIVCVESGTYPAVVFELGGDTRETVRNLLLAVYAKGVEAGLKDGKEEAQKEMRYALGIRERNTDGHPRTCVVSDCNEW